MHTVSVGRSLRPVNDFSGAESRFQGPPGTEVGLYVTCSDLRVTFRFEQRFCILSNF